MPIVGLWTGCAHRAAVIITLAWLAATGGAVADGPPIEWQGRALTAPSGKSISAEVGRIRVPENRARPGVHTIEVAFVRVKARPGLDGPPSFLLAGGPGASGIALVEQLVKAGGESALELLGGDLIGIDERGVGLSRPNLESKVRYGLPLDRPGDPDRDLALIAGRCREVAEGLRGQGIDLAGYNSAESADDLDAIRAALGYDKVILWGRSYGSHLAFATLRRHGEHIERVIACCPEGPDHTLKLPSHAQGCLDRLSALVAADEELGAKVPNLLALMRRILDRLDEKPVSTSIVHPITGREVMVVIGKFDIQLATARALGNGRLMANLPAAYLRMDRGDFAEIARVVAVDRERAGVESAMKHLMDCSSGASPGRRRRIADEAGRALLGDAANFPISGLAAAWGVIDLGESYRAPLRSGVPVLFICGDLDARTPVANAEELLEGLPNGRLVVVENAGHDLNLFGDPRLRDVLAHFLKGRDLPAARVAAPPFRFAPPSR